MLFSLLPGLEALTNHLCVSGVFVVPSFGLVWAAMEKSTDDLSVLGKCII